MNQARKRTGTKKVLSMILVLVMLLSLLSMAAFTLPTAASSDGAASNVDFMRIFHLDCGRKYFSVSEIKGIIDQLETNHYTHLQLAFGNDGLRFLLKDMSVTVNGTEYESARVTSAIKQGNTNLTSGSTGELSESEMDGVISYANDHGIQIIPMFNAPGHMYTAVNAMTSLGINGSINYVSTLHDGRTSNWAVDPTDATAVEFAEALLQKYVTYFAQKGSTMFNIGADESGLNKDNYASYAAMVNGMNTIVKKAGMTTLAYNDGIYKAAYAASQPNVTFDNDIVICYWTEDGSSSVADFLSKGFKILNNNNAWYYVLGDYLYRAWSGTDQWSYKTASSGVQNTPVTKMMGYTGTEQPIGSILCVWCDGPGVDYNGYGYITQDKTTQQCVYDLIKSMADANPTYFNDKVKLPATDTDDQVSVVVTGKKGQTATVDAVSVTSAYQFDAENVENVASYNVTPMVAGQNYTAQGTVTLPVPAGWVQDASRIRAYIIDNGAVKLLSGTLADGKYTFDVPHFSEMGLLQVKATVVPISVAEGKTVQKTVDGNQTGNISNGDSSSVTVSAVYNQTAQKELKEITSANDLKSGEKYLIVNQRMAQDKDNTTQLLTNKTTGTSGWKNCLELSGKPETTSTDFWTITGSNGSYEVKYGDNGEYLNIGENTAKVGNTKTLTLSCVENSENDGYPAVYWNISYDGYYLNNLGGEVGAGGWQNSAAPKDKGSRWTLYRVVDKVAADTTTVSFTGVKAGGPTYVTVGDTTYAIKVTEKQTVEIPISIVDYRADGLLFDYTYLGNSYAYGLVHVFSGNGSHNFSNIELGQTLDGANYGTKINGTTLERTRTTGDVSSLWGDNAKNDNSWSRAGLVKSDLGSNGMPVYTEATVEYVAGLLSSGNYNTMSDSRNTVLQNTFLVSGASRSVLGTSTTEFSDAFKSAKTYDNISTAYDLAWYLLNTIYQPDTNMTTVIGDDGQQHNVPIYGMGVDTYSSIVLTDNGDGKYSFNAGYTGNVKKVLYDRTNGTISESSNGQDTTGFYPIDGLGYEQSGLLSQTSAINGGVNNGSFTLRGESQFVYEHDKDLYFTFTGDDDVYMYINGKLALDLGGAHGRNTKTVNLNDLDAGEYGLVEGQVATFTFFYMERCSDASTFGIETNMELVKRGISVQKNAYDAGYANEILSGTAVETGRSVYYDLVVTNQSNALMNHICFNDKDDRGGIASFGFGVVNAAVTAGTTKTNGTVSLGAAGTYEIYVTDANNAEVAGTRQTFGSLSELSDAVAAVELQPGQSLHVRFLTATFAVKESKILNYVNTVHVTAAVGSQQLSDEATNELYSYNANDTSRTYVVDFGLPLQITGIFDSGAENNIGNVKLNDSNTLKYGTVVLTSNGYNSSLVYTRTDDKAINDAETIVLDVTYKMGSSNVTLQKTLTIIPATSVYYEDSFASFSGNWTQAGTTETNAVQHLDELGKTGANNYGYDDQYKNSSTYSLGSAMMTTVSSTTNDNPPTATFTFKGTGFDLVSMTSKDTGTILVNVNGTTENNETVTKHWIVDTFYGYKREQKGFIEYTWTKGSDGTWHNKAVKIEALPAGKDVGGTPMNSGDKTYEPNYIWTPAGEGDNALYQIPVIHYTDLPYGEYTVTVTPKYSSSRDPYYNADSDNNSYDFYLDGVRIYNPAGDKLNSQYVKDGESYAQFTEIRNMLLNASDLKANIASTKGMVFVDGVGTNGELADFKNYGPNNEVYLARNQAIAFKISGMSNVASIQIGAKAPNGNATMQIKVGDNESQVQNLTTASDMYYKLENVQDGQTIVITNAGDNLLSLTTLKVTYKTDPSSSNSADPVVDEEVVAQAPVMLMSMLYGEPQTFEPEHFTASWNRNVRKGGTATLTVKASADVEAITVNGVEITAYTTKSARSVWGAKETYHVFTYRVKDAATATYSICAVNADGVVSDPIFAPLTVRPSIRDWWNGIFDKWKH